MDTAPSVNALYITKPYAYRPKEPPEPPQTRKQVQQFGMIVGGEPVAYNNEVHKLTIAGTEYDAYEWLELRHRIDQILERDGQIERVSPAKGEWDGSSTQFLTRNWRSVAKHHVGTWKRPPWWLRWLYSAVITKEEHGT
jgi:hypothetical protein